jgi:hypothetical protein
MTVEHAYRNIMRAETARIRDLVAETHRIVLAAKALLSRPAPDTFTGRRTYEPFADGDGINANT